MTLRIKAPNPKVVITMKNKPKNKINLAQLRQSLSECHLTSDNKMLTLLADVTDAKYFLNRVMECIHACQDEQEVLENSKLAIQLLNLYRVRTCGPVEKVKVCDTEKPPEKISDSI